MKTVTIVAYAPVVLQDVDALEWNTPNVSGVLALNAGETKSFTVSDREYDTRIFPQLQSLSMKRVPVPSTDTDSPKGRQRNAITWTVTSFRSQPMIIDKVEGSPLSLATPLAVTLTGRNLIPGTAASVVYGSGTSQLTFTAVRKGMQGNQVRVKLLQGAASPSVTTVINLDGSVDITIVPTTAQQANLIAAQITGLAAQFVSCVAGGSGKVAIVQSAGLDLRLSGGRGAGVAWALYSSVLATSWLLVEGRTPGNDYNDISLRILAASGGGSVSVSGRDITVTPASGTITVSGIAAQINANAAAAALVRATATGTSNISPTVVKGHLAGGSGVAPKVTIGGAAATFTSFSDTAIVLATTNSALAGKSVLATDLVEVVLELGDKVIRTQLHMTT